LGVRKNRIEKKEGLRKRGKPGKRTKREKDTTEKS